MSYGLLTLAFTLPLARHFADAIPGDGFDAWQNYWNLWWVKSALLERHTLPWFTDVLHAPTGVGLLFHTLNPFNGFTFLSVQVAWGLFPAYNVAVLFSFAVGGLGAYLLARDFLGPRTSRWAAFAAGAIFTFSPYHFAHLLGHMQLISLEWIPFYVLYLLRTIRRAPLGGRGVGRSAAMTALFLVLVTLCDWYYLLHCLFFTALVVVWAGWSTVRSGRLNGKTGGAGHPALQPARPRRKLAVLLRLCAAVAGVWLLWAAALSPLLAPMVAEARQSRFMVPDPAQQRFFAADLLAFVTPQEFHPWWGEWARQRASVFTATVSEHQVFVGFTVLILAIAGALVMHPRSRPADRAGPGLWILAAALFALLALGPVLHVAGRTDLLPGGREIVLPYGWLLRVMPFLEITRVSSRFAVMLMLALGVLAAGGLNWLVGRLRRGEWPAAASVALILFEFLPAPYPVSAADTPAWYRVLAADPRPGSVLNLPVDWERPRYLLYQTVHEKPLAAGYISRDDPRTLIERAPVLQHFRRLGADIIVFDLAGQGHQVLSDLGIRWVVLDRYQMPESPGDNTRPYTERTAAQIFGDQPPIYADERLSVYEVIRTDATAPYLILGEGWGAFDEQTRTRSFGPAAELIVQAPAGGSVTLRVTVAPQSASIDLPGSADGGYRATFDTQPGANRVMLRSKEPGARVVVQSLALGP